MGQVAKKYIERATRYTLVASDKKNLKFAIEGDKSRIFTTSLVNISLSGLAFVTEASSAPKLNDIIKLEFSIPGGEQVAWWAKVVRIEVHRDNNWKHSSHLNFAPKEKLIAVRFEQVPEKMKIAIHKGVITKTQEQKRIMIWKTYSSSALSLASNTIKFYKRHGRKALFFTLCTLLTFALLYVLSRPSGNYTPDRGAPWGQRFK